MPLLGILDVRCKAFNDALGFTSVTSREMWEFLDGCPEDDEIMLLTETVGLVTVFNPAPRELIDATTPRARRAVALLAERWGCEPRPDATDDRSRDHGGWQTLAFRPSERLERYRSSPLLEDDTLPERETEDWHDLTPWSD